LQVASMVAVADPTAVVLRPVADAAWTGEWSGQGLEDALATWFGPSRP
jgi:3-(3-hydroxy-phenyl)propionate hydroxylase